MFRSLTRVVQKWFNLTLPQAKMTLIGLIGLKMSYKK